MHIPSQPLSLIAILTSLLIMTSCGFSYEERESAREAARQKTIAAAQETMRMLGSAYGAKPWELGGAGGESQLTAGLQQEIEGSTVVFRAHIIDVVRRSEGEYEVILGSYVAARDMVVLSGPQSMVEGILANPPSRYDEVLIVAEIEKVSPMLLEISLCDDPECIVSLELSLAGVAHRIVGRLIALQMGS